jgi:hypothetical protein
MVEDLVRILRTGRFRPAREAHCREHRRVFEIKPMLGKSVPGPKSGPQSLLRSLKKKNLHDLSLVSEARASLCIRYILSTRAWST